MPQALQDGPEIRRAALQPGTDRLRLEFVVVVRRCAHVLEGRVSPGAAPLWHVDGTRRALDRAIVRMTWINVGAPGRSRTCDLSLRRRLLYPLSYWGLGHANT